MCKTFAKESVKEKKKKVLDIVRKKFTKNSSSQFFFFFPSHQCQFSNKLQFSVVVYMVCRIWCSCVFVVKKKKSIYCLLGAIDTTESFFLWRLRMKRKKIFCVSWLLSTNHVLNACHCVIAPDRLTHLQKKNQKKKKTYLSFNRSYVYALWNTQFFFFF